MKRRTFLQQAGVLLTGATTAAAVEGAQPQEKAGTPDHYRPDVLVTSPETDLGRALTDALGAEYRIREAGATRFRDEAGRLERAIEGVNAIVHVARFAEEVAGAELLDCRARETYDLLTAAAAQGVELVVYLSSLQIMAGYDSGFQVAEDWCPVPAADAGQLAHYLAERVCCEFARERKLRAVVLRLGEVVRGEPASRRSFDPPWVDRADVVQAVRLTLDAHFRRRGAGLLAWNVLHVAADVPGGRFPVTRAKRVLGYSPQSGPSA